jgi:hypothetical protein
VINEFDAAEELLKRRRARETFVEYCRYLYPDEPPADHHVLLCNALDDVIEGRIRNLMVFMPPGSAKSSYTSKRFPGYYLGKYPKNNIISASYGEGLSSNFGRVVRNTLDTAEYKNLFQTKLSEDSRAKGEWETAEGGTYFATGVGGAITGRRSDLSLIDDPVKGRENADSETERNKIWEWYLSDCFSRLKPNASQIVIQTRWHEDDLSGRLLPEDWNGESGTFIGYGGQEWTVICLPAQARENDILGRKEGEWLWPEWFDEEFWERTKAVQTQRDTRNWTSLYQQIPRPEEGIFFKREWFKRYDLGKQPPLSIYAASDYAVTKDGGDFTEHGVGGFDSSSNLYFTDWWSGQVSPDEAIKSQLDLAKIHNPITWYAEVGVIRRAIEPFLIKEKQNRDIYFHNDWLPHIGDKGANVASFKGLASMGKVYIPNTEWGDELINQLIKFIPNTNYRDDKVDVCGYFGRALNKTFGPTLTVVEEEKKPDSYGLDEEPESNWITA